MRPTRVAVSVLAILVAAPGAAADWLQEGGDAQRTGRLDGAGPAWDDVALESMLPVNVSSFSPDRAVPPIVVGDSVYALLVDLPQSTTGLSEPLNPTPWRLFRIPLQDGWPVAVATFDAPSAAYLFGFSQFGTPAAALASDGTRVFVALPFRVWAYSVADDGLAWTAENPLAPDGPSAEAPTHLQHCGQAAVEKGKLYVACVDQDAQGAGTPFLSVFDAATGGRLVTVLEPPGPPEGVAGSPSDASTTALAVAAWGQKLSCDGGATEAIGLAIQGATAILTVQAVQEFDTAPFQVPAGRLRCESSRVWAVDVPSGATAWACLNLPTLVSPEAPNIAAPAMVLDGQAYVKHNDIVRTPVADGNCTAPSSGDLRDGAQYDGDLGAGCAAVGHDALCGFSGRTYRLDEDLSVVWRQDLPEGERWAFASMAAANGTLYGLAESSTGAQVVYALSPSGQTVWRHALPRRPPAGLALGPGLVVVLQPDGHLWAFGGAASSPGFSVHPTDLYPAPGEDVAVDLHLDSPGLGRVVTYRADWGDGDATDWQESPVLTHRFSLPADAHARFYVRNDRNQTASVPVTFFVGRDAPAPSFISEALKPRNQNLTFFLLGLAATAAVGLYGLARAGRKRRLLARELRSLEADFRRLEADAGACDAMLAERRTRARALLLEKRLEEAHATFLAARVDELRHGLRLVEVDERLDFLPQGMVKTLREMLRDARITEWERKHFLDALQRDRFLTTEQKRKVQALVDGWFRRDAGAAP